MANKEFKIQSDTISLNGVSLSSSADGKVVLPGVTRATNYVVKEIDNVEGNEGNPNFNSQSVMVLDNAQFNFYAGITSPSPQYMSAQYLVQLEDDGTIDEIDVDVQGLYSDADRSLATGGLMWATDVPNATDNFNINDWVQIPFLPKFQAASVESDLGGGNANTGSITFEDNNIIGAGEDSGDGNGYDTIRLVPDADLMSNDQYLIIDPTAPGHIHVRAGGTQDSSNAELFLGGEKNHVKVNDFNGVRLQNQRLVENFYYYSDATSFTAGGWYQENGNWYVEFTTTDQVMINHFWEFTNGGQNRIVLNQNDTLEYGGWAANTSPDVYKVQVNTGPLLGVQPVGIIEFQLFTTETNNIILENGDFRVDVYDDIRMFGRDIFRLVNYSVEEPIEITTNYNNNSYTWSFQPNGTLNFPDGSTQTTAYTGATPDNETLDSVTGRGATTTNNITVGAVVTADIGNKLSSGVGSRVSGIRPPDGAGANNGYVWVPDETQISSLGDITGWTLTNSDGMFSTTVVQMRYDLGASWAIQTADPLIYTGTYTFTSPDYAPPSPLPVNINVNANTWTFGTNGYLTLPTGGTLGPEGMGWTGLSNGVVGTPVSLVYKTSTGNLQSSITVSGGNAVDGEGSIIIDTYSAATETYRQWSFSSSSNGGLTFPDSTVQTTAWAGGRVVNVPTSSIGSLGDKQGDMAFNGSYIYYCTQDFVEASYSSTIVTNYSGTFPSIVKGSIPQPQAGWILVHNGNSYTLDANATEGNPGEWTLSLSSSISVTAGDSVTIGPASVTNIWKRVAWSGDTW